MAPTMTALLYVLLVVMWLAPLHAEAERVRWRQLMDCWSKAIDEAAVHFDRLAAAIRGFGLSAADASDRLTVRTNLRDGMAHLEDVVAAAALVAPTYHGPPMPGWGTRQLEQSDVDAAPGMTLDELLGDIDHLIGDTHDR